MSMKNYEHIIQRYIPRVKEKHPEEPDGYGWYSKELDDWYAEYDRMSAKIKKYTDPMFTIWCEGPYTDIPFNVRHKWYNIRNKAENILWKDIYLTFSSEIEKYHISTDPIVLVMEKWSNGVFPPFNEQYLIDKKKNEDWNRKYYRCTALIWYLKSKLKHLEEIIDRNKNDLDKLIKLAQIAVNKKSIAEDFKEEENKEEKG